MSMFRALMVVFVALMLVPVAAEPAMAQHRSLFEALFGNQQRGEPQPAQQPQTQRRTQQQPAQQPRATQPRAPQPQASLPPPRAVVAKDEDAKRIMVFGDSLAVDLSRAMERFYDEDPETVVFGQGVGSSGFVRADFFDWNATLQEAIAQDRFDIAVIMVGINDRQQIGNARPLTEDWKQAYSDRIGRFLAALRAAGKPAIWVELPPMEQSSYSADMAQISSLHRMAAFAHGAEWVEVYDRYVGEDGGYSANGPDLNGQIVNMRKSDGIHFSTAGADKLAFYIDRAVRPFHTGGSAVEVADLLAGTDAGAMLRPPFQGLGQIRLLEVAGAVQQLGGAAQRSSDLLLAAGGPVSNGPGFEIESLFEAPAGRVDAFGLGRTPGRPAIENPRGR